jgi:hypothetical protein
LTILDPRALRFVVNAVLAIAAWVIADGIERQARWGQVTAYLFGVLELFSFPIGTVVGIFTLVYLTRATKAGLFRRVLD